MAYSREIQTPNINLIPLVVRAEVGPRGVSEIVSKVLGIERNPKASPSLIAIEPYHDPTRTSVIDSEIYYVFSNADEGGPKVILCSRKAQPLRRNGTNAINDIDQTLNEFEQNGFVFAEITPINTLTPKRKRLVGDVPQGPGEFEVYRDGLKLVFEDLTGIPAEAAFRIENIGTLNQLKASSNGDIASLSMSDTEKIVKGWELLVLIPKDDKPDSALHLLPRNIRRLQMDSNSPVKPAA